MCSPPFLYAKYRRPLTMGKFTTSDVMDADKDDLDIMFK